MSIQYIFLIIGLSVINISCHKNCNSFKQSNQNIYGIDISHYQDDVKQIDWQQVKDNTNPKISFAYIRTTMGKDGKDKSFTYNFSQAQMNGIKVGVYHYFRPNESAIEQFKNFAKNTTNIGDLPPVLDIEEIGSRNGKKIRKEINIFLNLVEQEFNIKPIIYAHQRFYNTYLRNRFNNYQIWIARQNGSKNKPDNNTMKHEPIMFDSKCPLIWQYSGTGTINGITGYVDLNVAHKTFLAIDYQ